MHHYALLVELFLVVGVVLGFAAWDLRKTSRELEKSRQAKAKAKDEASETEASL